MARPSRRFAVRIGLASALAVLAHPATARAEGPDAIPTAAAPSPTPTRLEPLPTKKKDLSPLIRPQAPKAAPTKKPSAAKSSRSKPAQPPSSASKKIALPPLLRTVEEKYSTQGSLVASFTQINESAALKKETKSSGFIEIKRPDRLRWEQRAPDASLLVSNGKTFWFYTPPFDESEPGQVIIRKTSQVQSKLASSLLMGDFSGSPLESVKQKTPSRFTLVPKPGTAGTVARMEVQINPDTYLIMGVGLYHRDGNRTEISLEDVKLGTTIPDDRFEFAIPKNAQVLKE